jgi:predicted RNA-binding Zn ribbon-like protein
MLTTPDLALADLVPSLANTAPPIWRDRAEHLVDATQLSRLLNDHGVAGRELGVRDIERARALRPLLRAPFDAGTDTRCVIAIDELLAELAPTPRLEAGAVGWAIRWRCASGLAVEDAIATAAYALAGMVASDGRRRLGHCAHERCDGVFVDTTRNRSRRFCMPELCGNRANVAAHRRRRASPDHRLRRD